MNALAGFTQPFFQALLIVLDVIRWMILVWVVLSWLLFFATQTSFRWRYREAYGVLDQLNEVFNRMTRPLLRPFRRILPPHRTGGIDWSPLLLLLAIFIIRGLVVWAYGLIMFR